MCTVHYLKGPLHIDHTTQPSSIGGPLGNYDYDLQWISTAFPEPTK